MQKVGRGSAVGKRAGCMNRTGAEDLHHHNDLSNQGPVDKTKNHIYGLL